MTCYNNATYFFDIFVDFVHESLCLELVQQFLQPYGVWLFVLCLTLTVTTKPCNTHKTTCIGAHFQADSFQLPKRD